MKIHEYQAKSLLKEFNIPLPKGELAESPEDAKTIAKKLAKPVVLKAQIHAGGRGKAGGILMAENPDDAYQKASSLIGKRLITPQSSPEGKLVRKLLVEEQLKIKKEFYLSFVIDRAKRRLIAMVSKFGGMEIEEIAKTDPKAILKEEIDPLIGLKRFQAIRIALGLGVRYSEAAKLSGIILALYKAFYKWDCSLIEINPLVLTEDKGWVALDLKINFDDNGLFRHPELKELRDIYEENPLEVEATKYNLNYIKLDGNVGCMVNGAGLAMATMDLILHSGGKPANFLDVGGGATAEMVEKGFEVLLSDKDVKVIFINIFGGILRCDTLAKGVVEATKKHTVPYPVVIRMEGTNVEEGRKILKDSGLNFIVAKSMAEGAKKAVEAIS
ncbi:MAG: ADP-forming succinate--CoA ligase subunit beta [Spirochaetes bacterium]|nr:MAG: ADP-forming succinate--CoA ligase subunit beta [Spirochaetota bacterium]RLA90096.1 MAG: ADP-forming succinate--CoA ligase subunit beta [Deltaproteobacteria bacterium]